VLSFFPPIKPHTAFHVFKINLKWLKLLDEQIKKFGAVKLNHSNG